VHCCFIHLMYYKSSLHTVTATVQHKKPSLCQKVPTYSIQYTIFVLTTRRMYRKNQKTEIAFRQHVITLNPLQSYEGRSLPVVTGTNFSTSNERKVWTQALKFKLKLHYKPLFLPQHLLPMMFNKSYLGLAKLSLRKHKIT
jgi:hypothetical protein